MADPKQIIEFMNIAEGLKRELRHSWLSDGRRESVAEHSWSASLLALLLFDEVNLKLDQLKVLKMIIIHDLVEIYAGDMPSFESVKGNNQKIKEEREAKALEKLLKKLPTKLAKQFRELWHEIEGKETLESKFVHVCDKADAVIQHNRANINSFTDDDYDYHPYYKEHLFEFNEYIKEFKKVLNIDSMTKIETEGDINKIKDEHRERWNLEKKNK